MSQPELFPDPEPVLSGAGFPASFEEPTPAARSDLLGMSLDLAVPLWVERRAPWTWNRRMVRSREITDIVGPQGDIILYRSKKKGETAAAFNALAEGIAIMSFHWGGVSLFGRHWHTPSCHLCGALQNLTQPSEHVPPRCEGGGCEKRHQLARQDDARMFFNGWCDTLVCCMSSKDWQGKRYLRDR